MSGHPRWMLLTFLLGAACKRQRAGPPAEVRTGYTQLVHCLVGAPLAPGETAFERMQRIDLGWSAAPLAQTSAEWPRRCQPFVARLVAALDAVPERSKELDSLRARLELVGSEENAHRWASGRPALVDLVLEDAKAAGLQHPAVATSTPVPAVSGPAFKREDLSSLVEGYTPPVQLELSPEIDARAFVTGSKGLHGCTFEEVGAPRCPLLTTPVDAVEPLLQRPLSGARGDWIVSDHLTGKRVGAWPTAFDVSLWTDAYVLSDRSLAGWDRTTRMVLRTPSGVVWSSYLPLPFTAAVVGPGAGYLFVVDEPTAGHASLTLVEHTTTKAPALVSLGSVPQGLSSVLACRRGADVAAILSGYRHPTLGAMVVGAFRWGSTLAVTKAIPTSVPSNVLFAPGDMPRPTCGTEFIDQTWVRTDGRIGRLHCTKEKCVEKTSQPLPGPGVVDPSTARVVSLGEQVVLARVVATSTPLHRSSITLQVRVAPLDRLHEGPWQVVLGEADVGGPKGLHRGLDLVATGRTAILLSYNDEGLFAIRVRADGQLAVP